MDYRFYVSNISSHWNHTPNWSTSSGGSGGSSVPSTDSSVIFDGSGIGDCVLDSIANAYELTIQNSYAGIFYSDHNSLHLGTGGGYFDGGVFTGGPHDVTSQGPVEIRRAGFIAPKATFLVRDNFSYFGEEKNPSYGGDTSTTRFVHNFILTPEDILNKFVLLEETPLDYDNITLDIVSGVPQEFGIDFYLDENLLAWDGKTLENLLEAGDELRTAYDLPTLTSYFDANEGKVSLELTKDTTLTGGGISFYDLELRSDGQTTRTLLIDGDVNVTHRAVLGNVKLKQISGNFNIFGDMTTLSGFDGGDSTLKFGGDVLSIETGCVFSTLYIDRTSSTPMRIEGVGPLIIKGDFILYRGILDAGKRDIKVGNV